MHGDDNQYDVYNEPSHVGMREKPLDPAVERVRRKLMWLMVTTLVITMVLILAVLAAVIYKARRSVSDVPKESAPIVQVQPQAAQQYVTREITLPAGTRILSQMVSGDLVSLELLDSDGSSRLFVYNYRTGSPVAGITIHVPQAEDGEISETPTSD